MAEEYKYVCKCGHKSNACDAVANAEVSYVASGGDMLNLEVTDIHTAKYFCSKCQRELYR